MSTIFIQNGGVVLPDRSILGGTVALTGGRIGHAGKRRKTPRGAVEIDACGGYVTPGLIDVHIHGAGLVGWETCTKQGLERVSETLLAHGILRFVPTMMAFVPELDDAAGARSAGGEGACRHGRCRRRCWERCSAGSRP